MQILPFDDRKGLIWFNGDYIEWSNAKVHVLNHGLHYGSCAFEDECGICGGDGSSCSPNLDDGKWEIYYSSDIDFGGFQFKISNVVITGSSGGAAAEAGFTVSNGNDTVLGFSLSGAIIPKGSGVLTIVDIDGDETQACINNVVISDISGYSLSYTIDSCNTIIIQ